MKSKLLEDIKMLENEKEKEIADIITRYGYRISYIKQQCNHKDDNGIDTLIPAGKPFHSGWDKCLICGAFIETNEYGRN